MIDHASIPVSDLKRSAAAYEKVLASLGYRRLVDRQATVGFGRRYPELWLNARTGLPAAPKDSGHHLCLRAIDEGTVRKFHTEAIASGFTCDGLPGPRQGAMTTYFAAFIRDPDGNRVEAATFPETPS